MATPAYRTSSPTLTLTASAETWCPIPVDVWETFLKKYIKATPPIDASKAKGLMKNVIYSLQHIEFIDRCNQDLNLTSVIKTMNQKMFVVEGCSIIEALFFYFLIHGKHVQKSEWEELQKLNASEFEVQKEKFKIVPTLYKKLDVPVLKEMSFDTMIKRAQNKSITGLDNEFYKQLNHLRKLRNKVHLHILEDSLTTDYFSVSEKDINLIKSSLLLLLTSPLLGSGAGMPTADFLKS
jgi:hypothetical protein